MLALRGVPGVYFHSLVGTKNDTKGVQGTGHNRAINRRKFESDQLRQILADGDSVQRKILDGYRHMLAVRIAQPAFHPDADQTILSTDDRSVVALTRRSLDGDQQVLVLTNFGEKPVTLELKKLVEWHVRRDLLSGRPVENPRYELAAQDIAWLV